MAEWGHILGFLNKTDPRPAREQFKERYPGGWVPEPEMTFNRKRLLLTYADAAPMRPLSLMSFHDETVLLYPHWWVLILQRNGKWEAASMRPYAMRRDGKSS